ncbi:MAG: ATP-binding protein, partial [Candidatus Thorarchaeota archaeon]
PLPLFLSECYISFATEPLSTSSSHAHHLTVEINAAIDADRFLSVLVMNLLDNTVTLGAGPESHIWMKLREAADTYEITIADDGPGISDSVKKTLFDPNHRFGGVGIHQASQIVRKYGGSIEVGDRVTSDSLQDANFLIRLPKTREPSQTE